MKILQIGIGIESCGHTIPALVQIKYNLLQLSMHKIQTLWLSISKATLYIKVCRLHPIEAMLLNKQEQIITLQRGRKTLFPTNVVSTGSTKTNITHAN